MVRASGKEDMRNLVLLTFGALEHGAMGEVIDHLVQRVFVRHPDELLEIRVEDGVCRWTFKPMVELLLRHIVALAENPELSPEDRQEDIASAIDLAGF